jgi:hypothetical protein
MTKANQRIASRWVRWGLPPCMPSKASYFHVPDGRLHFVHHFSPIENFSDEQSAAQLDNARSAVTFTL